MPSVLSATLSTIVLLGVCTVAALRLPSGSRSTNSDPTGKVLFGSFTPTQEPSLFGALNNWVAYYNDSVWPQSVRVLEIGWDHTTKVPEQVESIGQEWTFRGAVPIVTWMPYPYKLWAGPTPNLNISNGMYDDYIDAFLSRLSSNFVYSSSSGVPRRLFLRFAPSPNGDWFPWSPYCPSCANTGQHINQTAASFGAMWAYVAGKVRDPKYKLGPDVVQMMFNAAASDVSAPIDDFFPSKAAASTVDWLAVTGINFGDTLPGNTWTEPKDLFGPMLQKLPTLPGCSGKPLAIVSAGTTSHPKGTAAKDKWIKALYCDMVAANDRLRMMSYHNADDATDIAVFGGKKGVRQWDSPVSNGTYWEYPSFKACVTDTALYVGRNQSDPQYVSTALFKGE